MPTNKNRSRALVPKRKCSAFSDLHN